MNEHRYIRVLASHGKGFNNGAYLVRVASNNEWSAWHWDKVADTVRFQTLMNVADGFFHPHTRTLQGLSRSLPDAPESIPVTEGYYMGEPVAMKAPPAFQGPAEVHASITDDIAALIHSRNSLIDWTTAEAIVDAVAAGLIPNLRIVY